MRTMKLFMRVAVAALAVASAGVSAAVVPKYKVEMLVGNDRGSFFSLFDLNDRGQVVGTDFSGGSNPDNFLWSEGRFEGFPDIGVYDFSPERLNNRGQIVGSANGRVYIQERNLGTYTNIDAPGPTGFSVGPINDAGHVLGSINNEENAAQFFYDGTATRKLGVVEQLGPGIGPAQVEVYDMNGHDVVLGSYSKSGERERRAFTYSGGVVTDFPDFGAGAAVWAISDAGHVAGALRPDISADYRPVLFRGGEAVDLLGALSGQGWAESLNEQDWVVGRASTEDGSLDGGFLYADGRMYDLNELLVPQHAQRWHLDRAFKINDEGQILVAGGSKSDPDFRMQALLTPVPEPQAWALMLAGLGLVGMLARGRSGGGRLAARG